MPLQELLVNESNAAFKRNTMDKRNYLILALAVVLILLIGLELKTCNAKKSQEQILIAVTDTLHKVREKNGAQLSHIENLESSRDALLHINAANDAALVQLQQLVKKNSHANFAVVARVVTHDTGTTRTIVTAGDTVRTDSVMYLYPDYSTTWNEKWSKGSICASRDSIYRTISFVNDFEIWQQDKGLGLFKPKQSTVYFRSLNPLSDTQELRSFSIKTKPKYFSLGIGASYGLRIPELRPGFQIGINLQFNLITF